MAPGAEEGMVMCNINISMIIILQKVFIMPKARKTHQDWMRLLCGVCLRKETKELVNINDEILHLIRQHHHPAYDLSLMPTVVCKGCIKPLRAKESGQKSGGNLPVAQYHLLKLPVATRRQAEDCQCSFCGICRMSLVEYNAHCKKMRAPPGRPIEKENVEPSSSTPSPTVICGDCKGISILKLWGGRMVIFHIFVVRVCVGGGESYF